MSELRKVEATAGLMAYVLFSATVAILFLVGALVVEFVPTFDGALKEALRDGSALTAYYYTAMVLLGGFALWVAWDMGRTSALTGAPVRAQAAFGVVFGAAVAWVNIIIAMLFVSSVSQGGIDDAVTVGLQGFVFLASGIVPVALLAVLAASFARDHYASLPSGPLPVTEQEVRAVTQGGWPYEEEAAAVRGTAISSAPTRQAVDVAPIAADPPATPWTIDCVRCGTGFSVSGALPLRVSCPECGKSGTLK